MTERSIHIPGWVRWAAVGALGVGACAGATYFVNQIDEQTSVTVQDAEAATAAASGIPPSVKPGETPFNSVTIDSSKSNNENGSINPDDCRSVNAGDTAYNLLVTQGLPDGRKAYPNTVITVRRPNGKGGFTEKRVLLSQANLIYPGDQLCLEDGFTSTLAGTPDVPTVTATLAPALTPTPDNPIPPDGFRCSKASDIVGAEQELFPDTPTTTGPFTIFDKNGIRVGSVVYRTTEEYFAHHNQKGSLNGNVACTESDRLIPATPEPPTIPTPLITSKAQSKLDLYKNGTSTSKLVEEDGIRERSRNDHKNLMFSYVVRRGGTNHDLVSTVQETNTLRSQNITNLNFPYKRRV